MRSTTILLPLVVVSAALALAGCSSTASTSGSTPTASSSSTSSPKCVDGTMTVTGEAHAKINATVGCDSIVVKSSGAVVSLRDTKSLTIVGTGNTVTVDSASTIAASGSKNTVFYGAVPTPKVTDTGSGNSIAER